MILGDITSFFKQNKNKNPASVKVEYINVYLEKIVVNLQALICLFYLNVVKMSHLWNLVDHQ